MRRLHDWQGTFSSEVPALLVHNKRIPPSPVCVPNAGFERVRECEPLGPQDQLKREEEASLSIEFVQRVLSCERVAKGNVGELAEM